MKNLRTRPTSPSGGGNNPGGGRARIDSSEHGRHDRYARCAGVDHLPRIRGGDSADADRWKPSRYSKAGKLSDADRLACVALGPCLKYRADARVIRAGRVCELVV